MSTEGRRSGNGTLILWSAFVALAALAVVFLVTFIAGSRPKEQAKEPPAKLVVVRADVLAKQHPWYVEIDRLKQAESRLRNGAPEGVITLTGDARLTAVPTTSPAVASGIRREIAARRELEQIETEQEAQRGLALFERGRANRLERLVERLRIEKRAEIVARDEAAYREKRAAIDRSTVESLSSLMTRRSTLRAEIATLGAQLGSSSVVLPPVSDPDILEREVAAIGVPSLAGTSLEETTPGTLPGYISPFGLRSVSTLMVGQQTYGIGMRPRLEYRRRIVRQRLDLVDKEIDAIIARGDEAKKQLALKSDAERDAEVDAAVRALRESQSAAPVEQSYQYLADSLDREERAARQPSTRFVGKAVPVETMAVSAEGSGATGRTEAAERLARRRNELERWVVESVSELVRDVAANHKWNVRVVHSLEEAQAARAEGRTDATEDFARWIAPGASTTGAL